MIILYFIRTLDILRLATGYHLVHSIYSNCHFSIELDVVMSGHY